VERLRRQLADGHIAPESFFAEGGSDALRGVLERYLDSVLRSGLRIFTGHDGVLVYANGAVMMLLLLRVLDCPRVWGTADLDAVTAVEAGRAEVVLAAIKAEVRVCVLLGGDQENGYGLRLPRFSCCFSFCRICLVPCHLPAV